MSLQSIISIVTFYHFIAKINCDVQVHVSSKIHLQNTINIHIKDKPSGDCTLDLFSKARPDIFNINVTNQHKSLIESCITKTRNSEDSSHPTCDEFICATQCAATTYDCVCLMNFIIVKKKLSLIIFVLFN